MTTESSPIPDLGTDQFLRTRMLVGAEGLARLQQARVTVVGLGAVGSYAAEALARAGVGSLRLVDFDVVQPSNLNRQLYALHSTLGRPKIEVARARLLDINPDCAVEALPLFLDDRTVGRILDSRPQVLVDAIDSVNPKVTLLAAAVAAGIPLVLSSMGAALRRRFADIRVGDLDETENCPLARFVRKKLHRQGITSGIRCVYSVEPVRQLRRQGDLPELPPAEAVSRGNPRRALGSLPTMTAIFGLLLAHEAILALAEGRAASPPGEAEPRGQG